ncbi:phosphoribulokinase family protein-related protein [Anaeramoeba flamelloides]|uniref:Phosphoribulokinase family protein-related protein n=1 Tax=Anaeramoeba flamelloides TaxID=1746091 RepID=A0AAV8AIJ4_9EUKA|nr:phosphoribulokinase family protein-related protein [Anaeramoeba flamelloides]KAJ6237152.1 phosphoribulokinase family protein-related protein [Anaeramoeba flamelloides]
MSKLTNQLLREESHEDLSSLISRQLTQGKELEKLEKSEKIVLKTRNDLRKMQSTLSFLLVTAYQELYEGHDMSIVHSFGDGYFCRDTKKDHKIPKEKCETIYQKMKEYIESEEKIIKSSMKRSELIKLFKEKGYEDKLGILKTYRNDFIPVIQFRHNLDYIIDSVEVRKDRLKIFKLHPFHGGIILRFPTLSNPTSIEDFYDRPKLFELIQERDVWAELLHTSSISDLNSHIVSKKIDRLKWVAEGLHTQKLTKLSSEIAEQFPKKRIVTIAGPSSSGKTTFAKRLGIHFEVLGLTTRCISMDDYYLSRDDYPLDENGEKDFESIHCLNVKLMTKRLLDLLDGNQIPTRHYDFVKGEGYDDFDNMWKLREKDILIIEGIHGLNPYFTKKLGLDKIARIYVSAITQLSVDVHHRMSTSDCRLLRRIIRDHQFRGMKPTDNLKMWSKVRRGEEKNIFPYQNETDYIFNTSLVYEIPVLGIYLRQLLAEIQGDEQMEHEANRLLKFLNFFYLLSPDQVPGISILREFIGNSDFRYN